METITKEVAMTTVEIWNAKIKDFMENKLPELLKAEGIPVKNGKIPMNSYFKAMQIIQRQNFYKKGHEIQMKLRNAGYDVKMDMQNDTLVFHEEY